MKKGYSIYKRKLFVVGFASGALCGYAYYNSESLYNFKHRFLFDASTLTDKKIYLY